MTRVEAIPPAPLRSLAELFAVADAMERDAVAYYAAMASAMHARDDRELARVFERLADIERGHVAEIGAWRRSDLGDTAMNAEPPWPLPDIFDAPAAEAARSRLITPYAALAAAVRQEERAFAFWAYVAAQAPAREVRDAAERMAHEELEHVSLLRHERRRAFHAERGEHGRPLVIGLADLAARERKLAAQLAAAADPALRLAVDRVVGPRPDAAHRLEALAADHGDLPLAVVPLGPAATDADDLIATAEFLVETYLAAAEQARDEAVLGVLQDLAGAAVARLAILQGREPA
ncbi:rubrerythrin family protein [Rhodoplanes serenus]|uniref:Rubrerythrin family protein n=1 Tax=Rhodoplanes serenus TaxID=200615 RepID=A0A9X4XRB0_9BRAD|nr:ferritin family protein [Rhodoplanes serenus]MTW18861.1 rubrerythrin family protein [Rhodoplanes serenus]